MRKRFVPIIAAVAVIIALTSTLAYAGGTIVAPSEGTAYYGMSIHDSYKGVARVYPEYDAKYGDAWFVKSGSGKKRMYTISFADEHNLFTETLDESKVVFVWDERYGKCPVIKPVKDNWGKVVALVVFHSPVFQKTDFAPPLPGPLV